MELRFSFDTDRVSALEVDTVLAMEDGTLSLRALRDLVLTFMVDAHGKPLSREDAEAAIRGITVAEIQEAGQQLFSTLTEAALPPENGEPS